MKRFNFWKGEYWSIWMYLIENNLQIQDTNFETWCEDAISKVEGKITAVFSLFTKPSSVHLTFSQTYDSSYRIKTVR